MKSRFVIERSTPGRARRGRVETAHGSVETPALVPLASAAAVQSLTADDLRALGLTIVAVDGFELASRLGLERLAALGGPRDMMRWSGPLLVLSGSHRLSGQRVPDEAALAEYAARVGATGDAKSHGRQLAPGRAGSARDEGLRIASPVDGALRLLTTADVVASAEALAADIAVVLDQPLVDGTRASGDRSAELAIARTIVWARRSLSARSGNLALLAPLRAVAPGSRSAEAAETERGALFGVAEYAATFRAGGLDWALAEPGDARLLVGGADPAEIKAAALAGADLIVTAAPTALADRGVLYTAGGPLNARDAAHERDERPIEPDCACPTCRNHSRAYLRHLFVADELLGYRLAAIHNLHHLASRLARLRAEA